MKLAFFISDHGFGHLMRNLPVIKELIRNGHQVLLVCARKHLNIAEAYLQNHTQVTTVPCHTDAGLIVKPGTLVLDQEKTAQAVQAYLEEFPERIAFAKKLFIQYQIERLIADIVPWALLAAREAALPSYLMASFTWLEQYEGYIPEQNLAVLREAFLSAGHVLYYDLVNQPTRKLLGEGTSVGFVAREFHEQEMKRIREKYLRKPIEKLVFLSLGASNSGLDFDIDVSGLPYQFLSTNSLNLVGNNVAYLDTDTPNTQDYVKAADFCIAKAGWSTVSEMMLSGNPFAVLTRPDVPEDTMIIEELEKRGAALSVSVEELRNMGAILARMEEKIWPQKKYKNEYRSIASILVNY